MWIVASTASLISAQALASDPPTQILVNGKILTMDSGNSVAQAIAIAGGKIVAVGSNAQLRRLATSQTSIIDLRGETVIPGPNDRHIHAIRGGQTYDLEMYRYDLKSIDAGLAGMKRRHQNAAPTNGSNPDPGCSLGSDLLTTELK
jgi:predicted amidohydrolase YtcJ